MALSEEPTPVEQESREWREASPGLALTWYTLAACVSHGGSQ